MKPEIQSDDNSIVEVRELASDEIDAVAGGMINNPFNSARGWELIKRGDEWMASVGIDTGGGSYGQK